MIGWIILFAWIICGILAYCAEFAFWQRTYPSLAEAHYKKDMRFALYWSLFGPITLIAQLVNGHFGKHGFKFK